MSAHISLSLCPEVSVFLFPLALNFFISVPVCPSNEPMCLVYLSISPSICISMHPSVHPSIHLSVNTIYVGIYQGMYAGTYVGRHICRYVGVCVRRYVCMLYVCTWMCWYAGMHLYVSTVYTNMYMSVFACI